MACGHAGAVAAQRQACGELEACGIAWQAECCCPHCGRLVRLAWQAGHLTVWEQRPAGFRRLAEVAAPAAEALPRAAPPGRSGDAPDREAGAPVLMVTSDPALRDRLETVLRAGDVPVVAVPDGRQALCWLDEHRPLLLLLDLDRPAVGGVVVARAARRRYGAAVPLLVVTGADLAPQQAHDAVAIVSWRQPGALRDLPLVVHTLVTAAADDQRRDTHAARGPGTRGPD